MAKKTDRQRRIQNSVGETWLAGGPDKLEHPRWPRRQRMKRFDLHLVFPWGSRNRRYIKQTTDCRRP